ncbi:hypothetical protein ES703_121811 [subsurface metagenome]
MVEGFREQACFEAGLFLAGGLNDMARLHGRQTKDLRIDNHEPVDEVAPRLRAIVDPGYEERMENHSKRIQRVLRQQKAKG